MWIQGVYNLIGVSNCTNEDVYTYATLCIELLGSIKYIKGSCIIIRVCFSIINIGCTVLEVK
jgi:hypothetical protein